MIKRSRAATVLVLDPCVKVEHEAVFERVHPQVGDNPALIGQQGCRAALAGLQGLDIVRQHALQKRDAILSARPDLDPERQVDEPSGVPDGTVFVHRYPQSIRAALIPSIIGHHRPVGGMPCRQW